MKPWVEKAKRLLSDSLQPPKQELNELDWKSHLSSDKKRLVEHLCAFANNPGGGYLVFGIANSGTPIGLGLGEGEEATAKLTNLGRDAIEPPLQIEAIGITFEAVDILIVHVRESGAKPAHRRGQSVDDTFIRSGGSTRKASRQEVGTMMLHSQTPRWEMLHATLLLDEWEIFELLDIGPIFKMLEAPMPPSQEEKLRWMSESSYIERHTSGGGYITNLGAISAATNLASFSHLAGKSVRVIVYDGFNKLIAKSDTQGRYGYALSFERLLRFVCDLLPSSEVIEQALRRKATLYPEVAIREIIANAIIHQDFALTGAGPLVEIFHDRIEISNPGPILPSKNLNRLIGTQPESRNEKLANAFRMYKICEERGSGLIRAGLQVELYGLPPIKFEQDANHFKVTLYAPRTFSQMTSTERLNACYQHSLLKYVSSSVMTNKSLRERLKMPEKQRSMVSALISEGIEKGLIAPANPKNTSRKYTEYLPAWAVGNDN